MFHFRGDSAMPKSNSFIRTCMVLLMICGFTAGTALLQGCSGGNSISSATVDKYPSVATPTVTALPSAGISAARNYPFMAADFNLSTFGFQEQEFLIEGKANSYNTNFSLQDLTTTDNTYPLTQNATVVSTGNPYRTRMMVYRPTDPAKFNGTVIVEWVNASNAWDTPIHWFEQKNMIMRDGYAYVWISNQDMTISGTNGLKAWSPMRYGTLDVTNGGKFSSEELSWDIFSQTAKAVRYDPKVLGGLNVKKVLAVGESQSAMRLSIYLNSYHPLTGNIYDGALVTNSGVAQRTDLTVPIIKVLTESELTTAQTNETTVLQPDTDKYKTWFVPGSTHSNLTSLLPRATMYVRDFNGKVISDPCSVGQNSRVPLSYVYNAGIKRLEAYLDNGTAIPTSPAMQITVSATAPSVTRDANGIALGGIRLPDVAVPVALNSGVPSASVAGAACSEQGGTHVPFTKAKLDTLYPTHAGYVDKVTAAANQAVSDGFMLQEDAQDVINNASSSMYGYQLDCDGDSTGNLCQDQWLFPQHPSILNLRWHIYLYHLPDSASILAPVDQAAIQIASGYNTTDATMRKTYFTKAVALLNQYSSLIAAEAAAGTLSADAASYLTNQASVMIADLQI
jgi:hypothetical protein